MAEILFERHGPEAKAIATEHFLKDPMLRLASGRLSSAIPTGED